MATKEEHLWRLLQAARSGKPEIDMFRWAQDAAELDAAREELAKLKAAQPAAEAPAPPAEPGASVTTRLTSSTGEEWEVTTGENSAPVAQPAPPQETAQGGPFRASGNGDIGRDGSTTFFIRCGNMAHRNEALRLLNAGLEAEQLRARVAELEKERSALISARDMVGKFWERAALRAAAAENRLAQVEARERSNVAALEASRDHEKARADAAEARLHEADAQLTRVRVALTKAGLPEVEPYPEEEVSDYERSLRTGGRVIGDVARIERLAARVAELGHERQRVCSAVTGGLRDETVMIGSLVWDVVGLKSRADVAEKRVAELEKDNVRLRGLAGITEDAASAAEKRAAELEAHVNSYARSYQDEKSRADAAEAKLAALGENPIPRALVERHRNFCTANDWPFTADVLDDILAGREPGGAA